MRTRKSYRRRAWAQRIALVLLLAVVATLIIARIEAEPVAGEVSTTPEATPQETAVLRPEPTYIVEAIPTPEPTPTVVARYADVSMTEAERAELAAIIYLEARGEPAEGQQAVAEVILNRVISPDFPDSVNEVLHQGEGKAVPQFSTIGLLPKAEPTQAQYDAITQPCTAPPSCRPMWCSSPRAEKTTACGARSAAMCSVTPMPGSDFMRRSKFRTACGVVAGIGFFIMLVAAGGSDTGTLDRPESFCLAALGLGLFAAGCYLGGYIE